MTTLPALNIPSSLPAHARKQLAYLDAGITKAAIDGCISSESYRQSAANYRAVGLELRARDAEHWAERIELDPRLYVAGAMHNATRDGTTKYWLHEYIGLIEEQALARQKIGRAA